MTGPRWWCGVASSTRPHVFAHPHLSCSNPYVGAVGVGSLSCRCSNQ
jgi:hypothetical protein